jgi:uncharacterized membrane protein
VLVLALAVSLLLILIYLLRVRAALQRVATALSEVAERTAALERVLHGMAGAVFRARAATARPSMRRVQGQVSAVPPPMTG